MSDRISAELFREMAGDVMVVADLAPLRHLAATALLRMRTASIETAARWRVDRARDLAFELFYLPFVFLSLFPPPEEEEEEEPPLYAQRPSPPASVSAAENV